MGNRKRTTKTEKRGKKVTLDVKKINVEPLVDEEREPAKKQLQKQKRLNANLLNAVIDNDVEKVKQLLEEEGGDVNYRIDKDELNELRARTVWILNKIWRISTRHFYEGSTLLMITAAFGHIEQSRILIGYGADVNARDNIGVSAIFWAAARNDVELCRLLVNNGADVNFAQEYDLSTPLFWAVEEDFRDHSREIVEYLLSVGADPLHEKFSMSNYNQALEHHTHWEDVKQIIEKYKAYWMKFRINGENNKNNRLRVLLTAVPNCSPDAVKEIILNL